MGQFLAREEDGQDSRRRILSFSSEEPYQRWFGPEILDHTGDAVDLARLNEVGVLPFQPRCGPGGRQGGSGLGGK